MKKTRSNRNDTKRKNLERVIPNLTLQAFQNGLLMKVSRIRLKRRSVPFHHWMFNDAETGQRVLDFWPVSGTWYCEAREEKGKVSSPEEGLRVAVVLARYRDVVLPRIKPAPNPVLVHQPALVEMLVQCRMCGRTETVAKRGACSMCKGKVELLRMEYLKG